MKIIAAYESINQQCLAQDEENKQLYNTLISQLDELYITPIILTIDPLLTPWHSEQQHNHFRSGCAPLMALERAKQLINDGVDAVIIAGDDALNTAYDRAQRHQLMSVYDNGPSIPELYTELAQLFIVQQHTDSTEFKALAASLFENYTVSHQHEMANNNAYFDTPATKWFNHITPLFRGVDCANPLIDFSGRLLLCSDEVANKLNAKQQITVAGIALGLLDIDEVKSLDDIVSYSHLQQAYHGACAQAQIDFSALFKRQHALMEVYTCYPVVPMAFLIHCGFVDSLSELPEFLQQHQITISGGMNLARGAWNNPALSALIRMFQQLNLSEKPYGLVHGNGGIGYRQGVTILSKAN